MKFNTLVIAAVTLLAGCTVSESKLITDIDADLWSKICANDAVAYDSVVEMVDCSGTMVEIPAKSAAERETDCNAGFATTATWAETECAAVTFGDWKDFVDFDYDYCDATVAPSGPFVTCFAAHTAAMAN